VALWTPSLIFGDLFSDYSREFKQCYAPYVTNYKSAHELYLRSLENSAFQAFLEEAKKNPKCKNLDFPDLAITPVQRLPRYELLLMDLQKHTATESPDCVKIQVALKQIKTITNAINEEKREADSRTRMLVVQNKVKNKGILDKDLLQPGRLLIREGYLIRVNSVMEDSSPEKEVKLYCFLMSDILMCSKQTSVRKNLRDHTLRYEIKTDILLAGAVVSDVTSSADSLRWTFKIVDAEGEGTHWRGETLLDHKGWFIAIQKAVSDLNCSIK